jgi:alkylhydroperoxidase family enzyme
LNTLARGQNSHHRTPSTTHDICDDPKETDPVARIPYIDESTASERTRDVLKKNGDKNIFRMLAHSQSHFVNYCRLGNAIRFKGALDAQLREIAITRTGILCGSEYEVIAHKRIGKNVGVSDEKIDALEQGASSPVYSDVERAVLAFTDEVVNNPRPSDAVFDKVHSFLDAEAVVELHLAIGFYIMTSKFLCTFDIDLQTD